MRRTHVFMPEPKLLAPCRIVPEHGAGDVVESHARFGDTLAPGSPSASKTEPAVAASCGGLLPCRVHDRQRPHFLAGMRSAGRQALPRPEMSIIPIDPKDLEPDSVFRLLGC